MKRMTLKGRVENGKIIADAPADYPEGMELELEVVDSEYAMTPEEIAELNRDLAEAEADYAAGRYSSADELIAELRARG